MKGFWVLYVEGTNGGQHVKHYDLEETRIEAERLARKERGKIVYILECAGQCKAEPLPVIWEGVKWEEEMCPVCFGAGGFALTTPAFPNSSLPSWQDCQDCHGTGKKEVKNGN